MGTVSAFPTKDPLAVLPSATLAAIDAAIQRLDTATALEALTSVADLVAITLRREAGGRWWDICIESLYYVAVGADEDGHREQIIRYVWDAEECQIGGDEEQWELPDEIRCMTHFASADEALADALADLARRQAGQ